VSAQPFAELSPPYSTIVADPPWYYEQGGPYSGVWASGPRVPPYSSMSVAEIRDLPVGDLADADSHLYLWTTNRYLRESFALAEWWGFDHSQVLTWCKPPKGIGPGGAFCTTTEFVLFCRRGSLAPLQRVDSSWWLWPRGPHSVKPAAFLDLVEQVSPGPYVELFARAPRLGWDSWGHGYEIGASA
jgi:N6-adenosine-specific RNA methylase IME4